MSPVYAAVFTAALMMQPLVEVAPGIPGAGDGFWDALRLPGGDMVAVGYTGEDGWVVRMDQALDVVWEVMTAWSGESSELMAVTLLEDGTLAVAGNAGSFSPGARHLLRGATGRVIALDSAGNGLWELELSGDRPRVVMDIEPVPGGGFVCCGMEMVELGVAGYGWVGLYGAGGEELASRTFEGEDVRRFMDVVRLPGGDMLLGGMAVATPSFLVTRVTPDGGVVWRYGGGPPGHPTVCRALAIRGDSICVAAGGDRAGVSVTAALDLVTGEPLAEDVDAAGAALYGLVGCGDALLAVGHDMLADGSDSETHVLVLEGGVPEGGPLRIVTEGACRCRTLLPAEGGELVLFGEVSEEWAGPQQGWAGMLGPDALGSRGEAQVVVGL